MLTKTRARSHEPRGLDLHHHLRRDRSATRRRCDPQPLGARSATQRGTRSGRKLSTRRMPKGERTALGLQGPRGFDSSVANSLGRTRGSRVSGSRLQTPQDPRTEDLHMRRNKVSTSKGLTRLYMEHLLSALWQQVNWLSVGLLVAVVVLTFLLGLARAQLLLPSNTFC